MSAYHWMQRPSATGRHTLYVADLFAGAGGATIGVIEAAKRLGMKIDLTAVNHWDVAVKTHSLNFPDHVHFCQAVDAVHPLNAVPGGFLDLLVAGPECTHFSRARGGKPKNRQSRSSPFDIIHWLEVLYVQNVIIENVTEFLDWGPLYPDDHPDPKKAGKAIPELKGRDFRLFVGAMEELGYTVRWRKLKACDHGDPTSRERVFVQATRNGEPKWPTPTHCDPKVVAAYPSRKSWRTAREIIDWDDKGVSIYDRAAHGLPPLCEKTLRRIFVGTLKYSGLPFITGITQKGSKNPFVRAIESPIFTLTTQQEMAIAQPIVVPVTHGGGADRAYGLHDPLPTVTGARRGELALANPLLVVFRGQADGARVDDPIGAVCTSRGHFALAEPRLCEFLTASKNENGEQTPRTHSADAPLPTVPANGRPADLVQTFLTYHYGGKIAVGLDQPTPTVTASYSHLGLAEPKLPEGFVMRYNGGAGGDRRSQSLDSPISTLDTANRFALCFFRVDFYGNGGAGDIDDPLATVTTKDRFGLVELDFVPNPNGGEMAEGRIIGWVDILFRMLRWRELARAQGFPDAYRFAGNTEQIVAQIGNAWPGNTSGELVSAALSRPYAIRPIPNLAKFLHQPTSDLCERIKGESAEVLETDLFAAEGATA